MQLPLRRFRRDRLTDAGSAYRAVVTRYPAVRGFRPLGDADRFRFSTNALRLGPAMVTVGTSDGFTFQEAADGRVTIVCPLRGHASVDTGRNEHHTGSDGHLLLTGFDDVRTVYDRGFAGVFVTLEVAEIERALALWSDGAVTWDASTRAIAPRAGAGARLKEAIRSCLAVIDASDDLDACGLARLGLSEILVQATALALRCGPEAAREPDQERAASSRQIAAALAFIEANLPRPLRLTDIAAALGVSPRALQAAFQREHGCSPMQQVRESRLAATHRALQEARPGETVAAVARAHGFVNLGDFAVLFRQRYGRSPSQVLRNME